MTLTIPRPPPPPIPAHRPGEAPPNVSAECIFDQCLGYGATFTAHRVPGWVHWSIQAIEPIEGQPEDDYAF